jgi:Fe-S-cluster containining protein
LTTPFEKTIRGLCATETESASAILSEPRSRDTAVKLAFSAGQRADRTFLPVFQSVACKPGCGFCCRGVRIDTTAPEALTIVRGFRETMSEGHVAVVFDQVKRHAALVRSMTLEERYRRRVPCSMLDQASDRCLVHDARPMRCRAHHSLDAANCEAAIMNPDERRTIPRYPDVMDAHEAMILGQRKALAAAKLDFRAFDFSLALEVAFEHEDAAERWANGERLFDAAFFRWPDEEPADESDVPNILLGD